LKFAFRLSCVCALKRHLLDEIWRNSWLIQSAVNSFFKVNIINKSWRKIFLQRITLVAKVYFDSFHVQMPSSQSCWDSRILYHPFSSLFIYFYMFVMITNVISYFYIHRLEQNKYQEILSDFRYFKEQDAFDTKINASDVNFSFHKSIITFLRCYSI
jgi:hypothetical protein